MPLVLHEHLLIRSCNVERLALVLQQPFLCSFVFIFQVKINVFSVLFMIHSRFVESSKFWPKSIYELSEEQYWVNLRLFE